MLAGVSPDFFRTCGSQRSQDQPSRPGPPVVSRWIWRSRGLCRTAAWATAHRATARAVGPSPAMPRTSCSRSGTVTGTSYAVHGSWRRCSSLVGSWSTTSDGRSAVPMRSSRKSASEVRRSHRRRRGPTAVRATSAGSGKAAAPGGAFGRQGLLRVALDARLLLLVRGDRAGVGLAAGAPAHEVVADDHDRREQPEQQHRHAAENQSPRPPPSPAAPGAAIHGSGRTAGVPGGVGRVKRVAFSAGRSRGGRL